MESGSHQGFNQSIGTSSGSRRYHAYTSTLPRPAMPTRSEREVEMSEASPTYVASISVSNNPSRQPKSNYHDG